MEKILVTSSMCHPTDLLNDLLCRQTAVPKMVKSYLEHLTIERKPGTGTTTGYRNIEKAYIKLKASLRELLTHLAEKQFG